jgi:hypothetical protein
MSYEEVVSGPYKYDYIPLLRNFSQRLKGIDFIDMLKAVTQYTSQNKKFFSSPFYSHVLTYTIVEDTEKVFEKRITECLFAKTFREADASDIGYATQCYGDYGRAEGFNPKIRLTLTKTLMQGDDYCNHRWVWEG